MTNLLPCPFCGGEARLLGGGIFGGVAKGFSIECRDCRAMIGGFGSDNKQQAIEAWNKRHEPTWGDFEKVAKGIKVAWLERPTPTCNMTDVGNGYEQECDECGEIVRTDIEARFCPGCGARVEG